MARNHSRMEQMMRRKREDCRHTHLWELSLYARTPLGMRRKWEDCTHTHLWELSVVLSIVPVAPPLRPAEDDSPPILDWCLTMASAAHDSNLSANLTSCSHLHQERDSKPLYAFTKRARQRYPLS